ncbi:hypothetical protein LT330_008755 [Penicillium expansum]|nr:hypothetical protein LT330_008755 [Penicillium expansum]
MANCYTKMSLPEFSHDLVEVENDLKATTGRPRPVPDSTKRAQRDALVALNDVIKKLILERTDVENEIIRQRAVLADQMARLSTTNENIQSLQKVWEDMAAGFGLPCKK